MYYTVYVGAVNTKFYQPINCLFYMDLYFGNSLILIPVTFPPLPKYWFKVAIPYV